MYLRIRVLGSDLQTNNTILEYFRFENELQNQHIPDLETKCYTISRHWFGYVGNGGRQYHRDHNLHDFSLI